MAIPVTLSMQFSKKSEAGFSVNRTKPVCMSLVRPYFLFIFWFPSFGPSFWSCCWKINCEPLLPSHSPARWCVLLKTLYLYFIFFLEILPFSFFFTIRTWGHIRNAYNPPDFIILTTICVSCGVRDKNFWFQVFTNIMLIVSCWFTSKVLFNQG